MVEFSSHPIRASTRAPASTSRRRAGAKRVRTFRIYRFDPDSGPEPRVDTYEIDMAELRADGARCAAED